MGKPAARLGDMTAHGGSIVVGLPTVLIGGMPAARVGDMHVCPMLNPGVPPPPHVGGPIMMGSPMVLIGGMPAARMGDMVTCAGPPDTIMLGCMTVLIGEGGSGSAAGGGAGMSAAAAARASVATAKWNNLESSTKREHWVEFQFVDKAGLPVSGIPYEFKDPAGKRTQGVLKPDGRVRRDALSTGQCVLGLQGIHNARWSKTSARLGERLTLSVDMVGYPAEEPALFRIYQRDQTGPDVMVAALDGKGQGKKAEVQWELKLQQWSGDEPQEASARTRYSSPSFYFEVVVSGAVSRSNTLVYRDRVEIELVDHTGKPVANEPYVLFFPDGSVRTGKVNGSGRAKEENVPPGAYSISFPRREHVFRE